jgi:hypothetical protein
MLAEPESQRLKNFYFGFIRRLEIGVPPGGAQNGLAFFSARRF